MTQLSLLAPPPRPVDVPSVTRLLWDAAGRPTDTTGTDKKPDAYRCTEPCWWCGRPSPGWARPKSALTDTFPFPAEASVPDSPHLCMPCGWTLCDRIRLPASYAYDRIRSKALQGRRQIVAVRGGEPERWLTLELADGTVGLWTPGANAAAEKAWSDAIKRLRENPVDVGPCRFVEAVPYDVLDAGPVEKFRAFHHFATRDRWWPCTDTDRMAIRAWLLNPPPGPWVGVIGDGKKHAAIAAQLADTVATDTQPCVFHLGAVVLYQPADLARLIAAVEGLIIAGARDEEILSGDYRGRGTLDWLRALRDHEPVVDEVRGGPILPLALYLRRNAKELKESAT